MRDAITGRVFEHNKRMSESFIKSRIVRGGSAKIEHTIRSDGWDGLSSVATVAVYIKESTGTVANSKIVLSGTMEGFTIDNISHIFPNAPEGSKIVFGNINLNSLRFSSTQMSTKWMPDSEFSWKLVVTGLNAAGEQEELSVSTKNLAQHNVSNISMRAYAQPINAKNFKITIGIAPISYVDLKKHQLFADLGYPLIEVNTFIVDLYPLEDPNHQHGIGFKPFLLDNRKDNQGPFPTSASIKSAACDLLSRSQMPTIKKSRKTWEISITKKDWAARSSSKEWPTAIESDDETEQETDISGECFEIKYINH